MLGEAGDKANAAASKIIRFYRKASALFRRSTAFRNEANAVLAMRQLLFEHNTH